VVKDGVVRTPERGVLEGVSRRTVIELCGALAIPLRVAPVPATDLAGADEVFLSSTGGGVLAIARIDGRPLAGALPGPVTRRLHDAYWALHDEPRHRDPVTY
jgi:branched-chain amino acid aminotransferase